MFAAAWTEKLVSAPDHISQSKAENIAKDVLKNGETLLDIRQMVKLFEYNRLKGCGLETKMNGPGLLMAGQNTSGETDDAEWNIAVTIMTARRREPNFETRKSHA